MVRFVFLLVSPAIRDIDGCGFKDGCCCFFFMVVGIDDDVDGSFFDVFDTFELELEVEL